MKCPKCNSENSETKQFCGDCGTRLAPPEGRTPIFTETIETSQEELTAGTTLSGRYQIIEELGRGGMGKVYRAEDTSLSRHVAIKVLPEEFASDPERLARFEREAKLLASINHPNIATIHGLETSKERRFLVMELIEGVTLRERLQKGPLPVEETLQVCLQIAEGLESAHEKGIVHRDLKPANVKLTPEGNTKILDFGIAKIFPGPARDPDSSQSPAISDEITKPGMIVGTIAYMSPEQTKGKTTDKRTDIWAFGCILYECLTGNRAFSGETTSEMLASILKDELDWSCVSEAAPSKVRDLLKRCLKKDPRDRLHDIADARIVIQDCLNGSDDILEKPIIIQKKPFLASYGRWILIGLIVGLISSYLILGKVHTRRALSELKNVQKSELITGTSLAVGRYHSAIAISPEGRRIVFKEGVAPGALYQRQLSQNKAVPIPGTEGAGNPFFSPNGDWLGYFQNQKLMKISLDGGDPQELCDAVNAFGGSWGANGEILFAPHVSRGLWLVDEKGGTPRQITAPTEREWGHLNPVFLPDGRFALFAIWYGSTRNNLALLDTKTGDYSTVLRNVNHAIYTSSGHLVIARPNGLYGIQIDLKNKTVIGQEVPLVRDIMISEELAGQFDISQTGTLAYLSGQPRPAELLLVDLEGNAKPLAFPPRIYRHPRFSPDGKKFSVSVYEGGEVNYYIGDLETVRMTLFTTEGSASPPSWLPDNSGLIFESDRSGEGLWKTYKQLLSGMNPELLIDPFDLGIGFFSPFSFSKDGRFLLGMGIIEQQRLGSDSGNGAIFWSLDESKYGEVIKRRENVEVYNTMFSPDGKWVVYVANGRFRGEPIRGVFVTKFPDGDPTYQVSIGGGKLIWAPDGKLYYLQSSNMMVMDVQTEPVFKASTPRALFNLSDKKYYGGNYYTFPNWDISPDGKIFLMMRNIEDWSPPRYISIITNFFEELRQKVPIKN